MECMYQHMEQTTYINHIARTDPWGLVMAYDETRWGEIGKEFYRQDDQGCTCRYPFTAPLNPTIKKWMRIKWRWWNGGLYAASESTAKTFSTRRAIPIGKGLKVGERNLPIGKMRVGDGWGRMKHTKWTRWKKRWKRTIRPQNLFLFLLHNSSPHPTKHSAPMMNAAWSTSACVILAIFVTPKGVTLTAVKWTLPRRSKWGFEAYTGRQWEHLQYQCWVVVDIAFDRLQDGQSNDKRVEVSHGYTYEVMSDRKGRKMRKEEGTIIDKVSNHRPNNRLFTYWNQKVINTEC